MVLGLAAMAAGGGEAGAGIMAAGQQAALGKYLAFTPRPGSRPPTPPARASSTTAGVTGKGMLSFFKKLQQQEYRYGVEQHRPVHADPPAVGRAHREPDRRRCRPSPAWTPSRPTPALEERFRRVKAKLQGLCRSRPTGRSRDYPETDQSIYAHYARAYAYHKARLSRQSRCRGRRAGPRQARRSLFPGDPGPDPARGGQAARGARAACAPRPRARATTR